ncbi:glycosyltransferase family 2 protein [Bdellovibrio sp. KM01]|uniref:glycosyltransferase family 2 protein n=1 Tax=Bdellovibrio sp. KM01 TaxID=2748865 RepID=UPI0015EA4F9A|nr:glycosyltransferase family 2 protein [Bdellovibrio sp. KM01]QLY24372.1 glycosyltransferase family 2 protein [Bdellovibrio sp. KM01]
MQSNRPSILLVIVNFNQSHEITNFLSTVKGFWPLEHAVIVDDGSTDASLQIIAQSNIKTLHHPVNQGVGAAIRTGILHAKAHQYEAVLIMSSNGKMIPAEIPTVVNPLINGTADYVTGSRFVDGGNSPGLTIFRRVSIPIFSTFCTLLLGRRFSDITCGFRAYKIAFLFNGTCDINQLWLSRYELEYYIHYWACQNKLRIAEVPVTIKYSHLGKNRKSKIRPFVDWWSMMKPLIYLRFKIRQ